MKIDLITPAPPASRAGNRITALRWAERLRELGHEVAIRTGSAPGAADLLVALHAWRSAEAVRRFRKAHPRRPIVVALTGTDIHRFQASHPGATLGAMAGADRLVALHERVAAEIPARFRKRLRVIYQSAPVLSRWEAPRAGEVEICVIGHLREEKDPFRAALAVRAVRQGSRLRVVQLGAAKSPEWASAARREMARNPRYCWLGEVPGEVVRTTLARARAMVLSSVMEGGANVLSEAIMAGLPVLASDIPGNVGLLGEDYPGYFPVGDTPALRRLMARIEREPGFARALENALRARQGLFTVAEERAGWRRLLAELSPAG
jgi:putative glycosyltransferase (TIGR04348 family)